MWQRDWREMMDLNESPQGFDEKEVIQCFERALEEMAETESDEDSEEDE